MDEVKISKKWRWFVGWLVAGLVYKTWIKDFGSRYAIDGIIVATISVLAGIYYFQVKHQVRKHIGFWNIFFTFFLIEIYAGVLIIILTITFNLIFLKLGHLV